MDQANLSLDEFHRKYPSLNYYSEILRFVTTEIPPTEKSVKRAVFLSVDNFCKKMLRIGET
jgi:hypothetical protein